MKEQRNIIEIDEKKCNGCGQCVIACAEGALEIVDGKARLVGEVYCDGLGACIGECPEGALTVVTRESVPFDEAQVEKLLAQRKAKEAGIQPKGAMLACGCPSSEAMELTPCTPAPGASGKGSALGRWPVKLTLLQPGAPYLKGADLLLLADCAACAHPDLHAGLLTGRAVAMGCPKLDNLEAHIDKLTEVLSAARPEKLTVVHMEVPCCKGFVHAALEAKKRSGAPTRLFRLELGRDGKVIADEPLDP